MDSVLFESQAGLLVPVENAKFLAHISILVVCGCVDVRISARPRMPLLRRNFRSPTTRQAAFCVFHQKTCIEQLSWRRDPAKNSVFKWKMQKTNYRLLVFADGLLQQNVTDNKWHAQLAKFRVHSGCTFACRCQRNSWRCPFSACGISPQSGNGIEKFLFSLVSLTLDFPKTQLMTAIGQARKCKT